MGAWPPIATSSRKSASSPVRDLLGPPSLLAGEDLAAYEALHTRIFKAIAPADAGDIAKLGERPAVLDKAPFGAAIADFYLTNPIARASRTMAACSELAQRRQLQAAE